MNVLKNNSDRIDNQQLRDREVINMTIEEAYEKLKNRFPEEELEILKFNGIAKGSITIKCKKCGEIITFKNFSAIYTKKSKKCICQKCGKQKHLQRKFEQSLKDIFPNEPFEIIDYTNTQKPCKIKCLTCGNVLERQIAGTIKTRKHLCPICHPLRSDELKQSIENFKHFIQQSEQWVLEQNIDNLTSSQEKISCRCKYCNKVNEKTMYDYMKGIKCRCLTHKAKEWFEKNLPKDYTIIGESGSYRQRVYLKHSCGYVYSVVSQTFINGYGRCPVCEKRNSKGERLIKEYLIKHNIPFEKEYTVILEKHPLRFDFYLPQEDIYIEFQGEQHFKPIDFFGGEDKFKEIQYYDKLKKEYAKDKLLIINYDEIDNINSILNLKFNDYPEKEYTISDDSGSGKEKDIVSST